jgi:hypothetical protein
MIALWLILWALNGTPALWVQNGAALVVSSTGAGLTTWGLIGAILLFLDATSGGLYRHHHHED